MLKKIYFVLLVPTILLIIFYHQNKVPKKSNPDSKKSLNIGNVPEIYLSDAKITKSINHSCANFPQLSDLHFNNNYWQLQQTTFGDFYLFGAYLDQRHDPVVRILALYEEYQPQNTYFCQLWYDNSPRPLIVESDVPYWLFRHNWGADNKAYKHPYLITCPVDLIKGQKPSSVSLVEKPCDNASNNLRIFESFSKRRKNFLVCVKGLFYPFEDKTHRLVEWIELLGLLGVEKIHFFELNVHPNTKKLLSYYENHGRIEVTPLSVAGSVSNNPQAVERFLREKYTERRLQEVIPYNDCLYRHLHEFKYVVLLDTDEVIIPAENTWLELIETLQDILPNSSSYMARNVYFWDNPSHQHEWFEGIPRHMHMLQHVFRARKHTKPMYFVKGFHDTRLVIALHNHFPFLCYKKCDFTEIDLGLAHLQHYRADCAYGVKNCGVMKSESAMDTRVWNFKHELVKRVEKTLADLNLTLKMEV
ncbi:uncharacterized protein LOC659249 [Tribolium castaneum]|uniref:Glycosyltransferase family 92 protein n=1 Tax=Tribolium castaneum TaxID=7070 RepID=D2A5L2_TRICA|nr:PREDICTED: uncharacterized protein LOC659249 [Tribolium castaneum]EFA05387.1 hypothetical protein TcasGA2_TC015559 [Tribolium castaneum]|eukprot:XP_970667.1 PREDICTED: uncharacterized protein LOC659249 [Tribolium castaneum]